MNDIGSNNATWPPATQVTVTTVGEGPLQTYKVDVPVFGPNDPWPANMTNQATNATSAPPPAPSPAATPPPTVGAAPTPPAAFGWKILD